LQDQNGVPIMGTPLSMEDAMTPEQFHDTATFVFGSLRRAAMRLGLPETTMKRMSGRTGRAPQPIPPGLAARLAQAERAIARIFPRGP
jgi:hypothetical protein